MRGVVLYLYILSRKRAADCGFVSSLGKECSYVALEE